MKKTRRKVYESVFNMLVTEFYTPESKRQKEDRVYLRPVGIEEGFIILEITYTKEADLERLTLKLEDLNALPLEVHKIRDLEEELKDLSYTVNMSTGPHRERAEALTKLNDIKYKLDRLRAIA